MFVLGTCAYIGSGQDTFARELVKRYDMRIFSMGDVLRDIAKARGISLTREHLQDIRKEIDKKHGRFYLPEMLAMKIREAGKCAIITGIRTREEVITFKRNFEFRLVFVFAEEITRYHRVLNRGEEKDPKDYQEFICQSNVEKDLFDLGYLETICDYRLDCNMPIEEFLLNFNHELENLPFKQILKNECSNQQANSD
jgi:cytidylate kinase